MFYGKNTVVMSSGISKSGFFPAILDRSPCGSGSAAIMANLWHKGKLHIGRCSHFKYLRTAAWQ